MFDSSALKGMKLTELQEIAKLAKTIKFNGVKKEALVEQILIHQAASNNEVTEEITNTPMEEKSKRARIASEAKPKIGKESKDLFSGGQPDNPQEVTEVVEVPEILEVSETLSTPEKFVKKPKFIKPAKINAAEQQPNEESSSDENPKDQRNLENIENTAEKSPISSEKVVQNPNQSSSVTIQTTFTQRILWVEFTS